MYKQSWLKTSMCYLNDLKISLNVQMKQNISLFKTTKLNLLPL